MTGPDPLAEYQAVSNEIHDITDGPGQLAWAAFHRAWMDGVQAVQDQARAEGALAERRRVIALLGVLGNDLRAAIETAQTYLLDGDGDV